MATEKRLIDANEVERKLRLCIASWGRDYNSNAPVIARTFEDALQRVIHAPTVDAVEVVRCKDCAAFEEKYHTVGKETGKVYCGGYCYHWDYEQGMSPNQVDGDDFCSYGERRTDAD